MDPVSTWGGKQGWWFIGPYHRKSLWVDPLRIECPLKFVLHLCSSYLLTSSFGTLCFSYFSQTPFPYYPLSTWGGKQGWWTLDPTIGPHPKTRPSPNSKPFQIHTEDNSLFLSLSPFSDFAFFTFPTSHSTLPQWSMDRDGKQGWWTLDPPIQIDFGSTSSKFKTLSNSNWGQLPLPFPFTLFGLCDFQIVHKLHFHSKSTLVSRDWGGKQGWWTLDSTIRPHPKTRPLPNSKPFQIHTEDNSLFLILHSFQLWHFSKFRKVHSHSKLDPLSVDHQPTESLGPQEGTIGRVYNFDLVQIQNPYKFQLRTTPSSFPWNPFHTFHFSKIRNLSILPTQYLRREARFVDIGASYGYSPEGCPNHSISRSDPMSHKVWGVVIHFDKLPLTTLTSSQCSAVHCTALHSLQP